MCVLNAGHKLQQRSHSTNKALSSFLIKTPLDRSKLTFWQADQTHRKCQTEEKARRQKGLTNRGFITTNPNSQSSDVSLTSRSVKITYFLLQCICKWLLYYHSSAAFLSLFFFFCKAHSSACLVNINTFQKYC